MDIYIDLIKRVRSQIAHALPDLRAAGDTEAVELLTSLDEAGHYCIENARAGRLETNDTKPFQDELSRVLKQRPDLKPKITPPPATDL